ncbi:MAG: hypothetical protein HY420_00920 [Candidatus Kerfeldbacteria bacterium]|nr:hypothetical protein [Candidatus Kerfeldbacteria bacterium]
MYMKFNNKVMAQTFYWFGLVMGVFAFFTEISGQQIYLSSAFYFNMSVISLLAAIALAHVDGMQG